MSSRQQQIVQHFYLTAIIYYRFHSLYHMGNILPLFGEKSKDLSEISSVKILLQPLPNLEILAL